MVIKITIMIDSWYLWWGDVTLSYIVRDLGNYGGPCFVMLLRCVLLCEKLGMVTRKEIER